MKRFSVTLIFFAAALAASAQTGTNSATPRPMALEDCIQQALSHNFDVQVQRYNPQISLYTLNGAYGGYDPILSASGQHLYNDTGPDFEGAFHIPGTSYDQNSFNSGLAGSTPWGMTYNLNGNISDTYNYKLPFNVATNTENSGGSIGVSLTQPLLKNFWIDNTRLTIRIAKNRLKYSEQGLRQQLITTVTAVENAYYELIYAQDSVGVQTEALGLAQTQLDQDRQRVQIGSIAERAGTIEQDEAQVAQSQASLISAISTLGTDQRVLKNLITDDYSKWFGTDIQPTMTMEATEQTFNLQESWCKGMNERPDLVQAKLNVEQQGIQLKYYQNQLFPEVDLIGSYGYNGTGLGYSDTLNQFNEGNRPFYSYGGQLTMPLSNVGPRNQLKSGKITLKQLLLELKQLEQNVMVEIDNAVGVAKSDFESVTATRQARIAAAAALDAEQKKYAVGKSTTFTVLQLQNTLTADRAAEIRALANYNESLATLAQLEGTTLERHNIDLKAK